MQFGVDFESGEVGLRIETELQNHFQLKCEMEFGILGSDDGFSWIFGLVEKDGVMDRRTGGCSSELRQRLSVWGAFHNEQRKHSSFYDDPG